MKPVLDPLEVLLDLPSRDPQNDGAAVRAHARIRRAAQLLEDVSHLLHRQWIICLDGGVTRHRGRNFSQRLLDARAAIEAFEIAGKGTNRRFAFGRIERRWKSRQPDAIAAELFDLQTELLERRGVGYERLPFGWRHLDQHRRQQPLALERT